jgi:hypothetical protein
VGDARPSFAPTDSRPEAGHPWATTNLTGWQRNDGRPGKRRFSPCPLRKGKASRTGTQWEEGSPLQRSADPPRAGDFLDRCVDETAPMWVFHATLRRADALCMAILCSSASGEYPPGGHLLRRCVEDPPLGGLCVQPRVGNSTSPRPCRLAILQKAAERGALPVPPPTAAGRRPGSFRHET